MLHDKKLPSLKDKHKAQTEVKSSVEKPAEQVESVVKVKVKRKE